MTSQLREDFESIAAWRADKAADYPDNPGNLRAVEILNRLAATADHVPPDMMSEYAAVFLRWDTSEVCRCHDEALRAVGFRTHPADATAFVREFIELVNKDRRRFETFRPRVATTFD